MLDFIRLSICYTLFQCPSLLHALRILGMSINCTTIHGLHTTVHMLHTLIMSNLTSPFGHSSNVNQRTTNDYPYATHSYNVHPYFTLWILFECQSTVLRLLFCPTPCVHMLPPMMVYIQVHILATHPCVLWIVVMVCVRRMMMRLWWVLCNSTHTQGVFVPFLHGCVCACCYKKYTHTTHTCTCTAHTHTWVFVEWVFVTAHTHTHTHLIPSVSGGPV
jgi:hypothetical protein